MVPPPFQTEGSTLPNSVPVHFERFYRETLRRVAGSRLRSSTVQTAYSEWASRERGPHLNYHQLRRYMLAIGHSHLKSNGIQYLDVALAVDVPDIPDAFALLPIEALTPAGVDTTIAAIDGAVMALTRLRRALTGAS